ncbi:MAG: ATP-binding cassette domain-containing protein [Polaromonas sp.]|uniref:ABC transporter ATP-binding protein n=1 Tax=Polaromonas sp. TaxID=1869339 RepID=UPI0017914B46|nr:ATP-binding cassette domain-containing protein [Polaromonas sp.]MBA3594498.1 ATP-binding cassette domain-containing protein [Polaromonas sp.]
MISSRQLTYRYRSGAELRFDDVDVPQGGVLLLRGASGSGKSTWLALAAALLAPGAGDITVAGQVMSTLRGAASDAWRARTIGFLPQKLHLSAALTVHGNLAMAQWAAGQPQDDARIREALAALGVDELAARKPAQLSGGQAQRVALARAVLLQPKVILADEPTASLDDETARQALALLQATAQRHGATLVIATHDARVEVHLDSHIGFQPLSIGRKQL